MIKIADWVTCKDSNVIGLVRRVAKDGSWAEVDWHTHRKRMPTTSLIVVCTITMQDGWTVTDLDRENELLQEITAERGENHAHQ